MKLQNSDPDYKDANRASNRRSGEEQMGKMSILAELSL